MALFLTLLNYFKMKNIIILLIGIFMFLLTTALVIMTPIAVGQPLDMEQKIFLGSMGIIGYLASFIYVTTYVNNKKLKKYE